MSSHLPEIPIPRAGLESLGKRTEMGNAPTIIAGSRVILPNRAEDCIFGIGFRGISVNLVWIDGDDGRTDDLPESPVLTSSLGRCEPWRRCGT